MSLKILKGGDRMRIFVTSDIHANTIIYEKIKEHIPKFDVRAIFFAGDICGKHKVGSLSEYSKVQEQDFLEFKRFLSELPQNVLKSYIMGNDDWIEPDEDMEEYSNCYIDIEIYNKFHIDINVQYFEWVHLTPFNTNREANENKLAYELNKLDVDNDSIIIAHDVPYGCLDKVSDLKRGLGKSVGSTSIREMILDKKPRAYFGGHIHEGFGITKLGETPIFNCACDHERDLLRGYIVDLVTMKSWQVSY